MKLHKLPLYLLLILIGVTASGCSIGIPNLKQTSIAPEPEQNVEEEQSTVKSLKDLLSLKAAQKCTWNDTTDGVDYGGTIYVSGKQFYQEAAIDGGTVYAINDGGTLYSWSTLNDYGIKMSFNMDDWNTEASADDAQLKDMNIDLEKDLNFKCSAWVVDSSKFEVPSDRQFMDLSELMKNFDLNKLNDMQLPQ